jgi:hypothetical protein
LAKRFNGDVKIMSRIVHLDPEYSPDSREFWKARFSWRRLLKVSGFITLCAFALIGAVSTVVFVLLRHGAQ